MATRQNLYYVVADRNAHRYYAIFYQKFQVDNILSFGFRKIMKELE